MTATRPGGVWAPAITPFKKDLSPDPERFASHARWLLANGCTGLAAFGTNSEANSLNVEERMTLLEYLIAHGVPPTALMPGTGCCALHRHRAAHRARRRIGLRGRPDAAAVLLQGRLRRRPVSQLL